MSLVSHYLATTGGYTDRPTDSPLIRHRPHWKWCVQQFFNCSVLTATGTCLPRHCLTPKGGIHLTELLPHNDKRLHIQTHNRWEGFIKYAIQMGSAAMILWHVGALLSDSSVDAWIAQQWVGVTWPLHFRRWRHIHPHLVGCYTTLGNHSSTLGCDVTQQWSEVRFPLVRLWVYRRNWNS
jgi:hypothetical protein